MREELVIFKLLDTENKAIQFEKVFVARRNQVHKGPFQIRSFRAKIIRPLRDTVYNETERIQPSDQ